MQYDYFSSLDQSNSLFVALSLPFPSSMLKLPNVSMGPFLESPRMALFMVLYFYASINLKPAGGGRRQGTGWGFDCDCCPRGGTFD